MYEKIRCNLLEMEGAQEGGQLKGKNMWNVDVLNVVSMYWWKLGSS